MAAWTRLTGTDGAEAALWVDRHHPYIEIYTGDTLPTRQASPGTRHRADDVSSQRSRPAGT